MRLDLGPHVIALALVLTDLVARGVRIRLLMPRDRRFSLFRAIAVNAYGDAASAVSPARLAGDPVRFMGVNRSGVDAPGVVVAMGAERLVDWALILMTGVALAVLYAETGLRGALRLLELAISPTALVLIASVVALSVLSLLALRRFRSRMPNAVTRSLSEAWGRARGVGSLTLATTGALTLVSMAARIAILPVLVASHAGVNMGAVLLGSFALLYSQLFLPTPAGAGGVELGFVGGFAGVLSAGEIVILLAAWRFYTLVLSGLLGAYLFIRAPFKRWVRVPQAPAGSVR